MKKILFILIFISSLLSCEHYGNEKFNKEEWISYKYEGKYTIDDGRKNIVKDIMKNVLKKNSKYSEIKKLLGESDNEGYINTNTNEIQLNYVIKVNYDAIDPIAYTYLIIHFDKDSTIVSSELSKWSNNGKIKILKIKK